jgi:hypothetical protein
MKKARREDGPFRDCHCGLDPQSRTSWMPGAETPELIRGRHDDRCADLTVVQAAASQYPALKGLLIRSARGETSTNLSVGIFSPFSVVSAMPVTASVP